MPNQKKFLDAAGVTHLVSLLDDYPNNEILGTVIDAIQGEMNNLILIQTTEPSEEDNKIWINNSSSNSVTVPTVSEMNAAITEGQNLGISGAAINQAVIVNTVDANGVPTSYTTTPLKYTLTVTCLTQDDVTVTGQTVTVREDDKDGPIYATAAYEGQPVSFALPTGFHYYISVSDTLAHHFNPTTATGIITNTNIANTLTYSDFHTIQTATDIKGALNNDIDLTDLVGEQITCSKNNSTLTWDVVDYDSTNKTVTLLLHNVFGSSNMVFEPAQNLMWCEDGLAAGDYYFKSSSTNYYFTLTTAIPAGGVLRATTSAFTTRSSQSATTNLESGTVSTTEIAEATNLGTTGSGLLNHMDRVNYGSNNFAESALFWWLNSDAAADAYRVPVTKFSRPYSYGIAGFLNGLDQEFLDSIDNTVWKCNTNNVYECPTELGGVTPGKQKAYTVTAKIGLASEKEIFGSYGGTNDGSTVFDLYNGATATDRIKYRGTSAQTWWVRSPYGGSAILERVVHSSGSAGHDNAYNSYGVVPACRISKDIIEE